MIKNLFEGETISDSKKIIGCYVFGFEDGEEVHTIVNQNIKQKKTGEFSSNKVNPATIKFIDNKTKMQDFLLQQLLGFRLGKEGFPIIELISGAGLTKEEWFNIKDETDVTSLNDSDIGDIEKYVNNL